MSLDLSTIENPTIIRGHLSHKTTDDENIFIRCEGVEQAKIDLEVAERNVKELKLATILEAFRECVSQFEQKVGQKPSVAQLGYYDKALLLDAFDMWYETNNNGRTNPSYSIVDGVKIVSGCHETNGEITLRLKE